MADILSTLSASGTEGTPAQGGSRYQTFAEWQAGDQPIKAAADTATVECYQGDYGTGSTYIEENLLLTGWDTQVGGEVTIRPAIGQECKGVKFQGFVWSNGATGNLCDSTGDIDYYVIQDIFCYIKGQSTAFRNNGGTTTQRCYIYWEPNTASSSCYAISGGENVHNNIAEMESSNNVGTRIAIYLNTSGEVSNNIAIAKGSGGFRNSIYGSNSANANRIFYNNVAYQSADNSAICYQSNAVDATFSNNSSADTTATGTTNGVGSITSAVFLDYANGDYGVAPGEANDGAVNAALDRSTVFTDDITGATREVPWDRGAFKKAGAAPGVTFDGPDIVAQTGTENVLFSFNENGEGNVASRFTGATSYAYAPGSDTPAGITVNATTGNLEGTPTVNGTFNITIEGSD